MFDQELSDTEVRRLQEILKSVQRYVDDIRDRHCVERYGKRYIDVVLDENVVFKNSDCIDIKNFWKDVSTQILQAIEGDCYLNRTAYINLMSYRRDQSGRLVRRKLIEETYLQSDQKIPSFFGMKDTYEGQQHLQQDKTYYYTYACLIAQQYASALSYALYL